MDQTNLHLEHLPPINNSAQFDPITLLLTYQGVLTCLVDTQWDYLGNIRPIEVKFDELGRMENVSPLLHNLNSKGN